MLGFDAVGKSALAQLPVSGQVSLFASRGTFTETGIAATFAIVLAVSKGTFIETGMPVTFTSGTPVLPNGSVIVTGQSATFAIGFTLATGSYAVTGNAATFARDFINWVPETRQDEIWTAAAGPRIVITFTPAPGWEGDSGETLIWTDATIQSEIWTAE